MELRDRIRYAAEHCGHMLMPGALCPQCAEMLCRAVALVFRDRIVNLLKAHEGSPEPELRLRGAIAVIDKMEIS